jgi:hypothetical protein
MVRIITAVTQPAAVGICKPWRGKRADFSRRLPFAGTL